LAAIMARYHELILIFCIRKDENMIDEGIDILKGWENF